VLTRRCSGCSSADIANPYGALPFPLCGPSCLNQVNPTTSAAASDWVTAHRPSTAPAAGTSSGGGGLGSGGIAACAPLLQRRPGTASSQPQQTTASRVVPGWIAFDRKVGGWVGVLSHISSQTLTTRSPPLNRCGSSTSKKHRCCASRHI